MASVTQNLENHDDILDIIFSDSLCKEILDGLLGEMRNYDFFFYSRIVCK